MNQLKEAEKKANQIVQEARKARTERLKEAKVEAEKIITSYKGELEAKYQAALAKQTGTSGAMGNEMMASANNDIARMNRDFNTRKINVEQMLLDAVLKVEVQAPKARV